MLRQCTCWQFSIFHLFKYLKDTINRTGLPENGKREPDRWTATVRTIGDCHANELICLRPRHFFLIFWTLPTSKLCWPMQDSALRFPLLLCPKRNFSFVCGFCLIESFTTNPRHDNQNQNYKGGSLSLTDRLCRDVGVTHKHGYMKCREL